jgi:hypothetical protein
MPQRGVEQWLSMFLDILEGDTPGSSEFGPDIPYGYAPAGYQPSRKHSLEETLLSDDALSRFLSFLIVLVSSC